MPDDRSEQRTHGLTSTVENFGTGRSRRVIRSDEIFGDQTSALIAHGDELYTLRVTKQGKLVLNK